MANWDHSCYWQLDVRLSSFTFIRDAQARFSATAAMFLGQVAFFAQSIPMLANDMQERYREKWTVSFCQYWFAFELILCRSTLTKFNTSSFLASTKREGRICATTMHLFIANNCKKPSPASFVFARISHPDLCLIRFGVESRPKTFTIDQACTADAWLFCSVFLSLRSVLFASSMQSWLIPCLLVFYAYHWTAVLAEMW